MSNTDGAFITLASGVQIPKVAVVRSTDGGDSTSTSGPTTTGGFIQITATGSSFALAPIPGDATTATIQVEAQAVRYRPDAAAATTAIGILLPAGAQLTLRGAEMAAARFIAVTAGAILNVYFSK